MKSNTKNKVVGFSEAFYCLPHNKMSEVKAAICDEMGWGESTFNSKRNGNRKLTNPESVLLKTLLSGFGIEF